MKKLISCAVGFLVVSFSISTNVHGRIFPAGHGLKAGMNMSTFNNGLGDREPVFGPAAGVLMRFDMGGRWQLQPEILFSRKGAKYDVTTLPGLFEYSGTFELSYIEVPVLLRFKPLSARFVGWAFYGGASVSALFDARHDYTWRQRGSVVERRGEYTELIRGVDVALTVGTEFAIPLGGKEFTIEGRLSEGLMYVDKYTGEDDPKLRSRAITLLVGLYFGD